MDTLASKTNKRNWLISLIAPLALIMAGCDVSVIDLTPSTIKSNPSNVYTITAQIRIKNSAVVAQSLRRKSSSMDKLHPTTRAPGSDILFEYDYRMPVGRTEAAYYMLVQFDRKTTDGVASNEIVSELSRFAVESRYSVELEVNRAPVGSRVAVLGRGFTRDDKILIGDTPAATRFDSSTSLSFYVPSLPEGRGYEVKVIGISGEMYAGSLELTHLV